MKRGTAATCTGFFSGSGLGAGAAAGLVFSGAALAGGATGLGSGGAGAGVGSGAAGGLTGCLAWAAFLAGTGHLPWGVAIAGAAVASLAELLPIPLDDNLAITLFAGYAMRLLWSPL